MSEQWEVPFTTEQVKALEDWQTGEWMHPYTCRNRHVKEKVLVPTRQGLKCPSCDYIQLWAYAMPLPHDKEAARWWKKK